MDGERLSRRVLAAVLMVIAGVILLWSLWMLAFLVGIGNKDNSNQFYVAYGGAGLLVAAALAASAALLLSRHGPRLWLWLASGALLANAFPYIVGYHARPGEWVIFHGILLVVALGAVLQFRTEGRSNDGRIPL